MGYASADSGQSPLPIDAPDVAKRIDEATFEVSLLALSLIRGLGRKGVIALVRALDSHLETVWQQPREHLQKVLSEYNVPSSEAIAKRIVNDAAALIEQGEDKVEELAKSDVRVIPPAEMPPRLKDIPDPPSWLFVVGNDNLLRCSPAVAVVGTRDASEQGRRAARMVAKLLAAYPITLISGLAEGIDEEAHRASLQEGVRNIAVLGHGIDFVFPAKTKSLRKRIVEQGGAVISEYLPTEHYRKSYFVERNRLQAALADLVIPVEANPKGGTAHTVRFSRKYGRPLAGISWDGADGILSELKRDGWPVFDIFEYQGRRRLDKVFRNLAEEYGHDTYAFSLLERHLLSDIRSRNYNTEDVDKLVRQLKALADEEDEA